MSIEDGRADDDDTVKKFSQWMEQKGIPFECPGCGQDTRFLARHFVTPSQMLGQGQVFGTVYPMLMLICSNCSRTEFFSAVAAGFYKSDQSDEAQE